MRPPFGGRALKGVPYRTPWAPVNVWIIWWIYWGCRWVPIYVSFPEGFLFRLLTYAAIFLGWLDTPDCKERLKATFQKLPPVNKLTAGCLFYFLSRVASCEDQSKMATNNLAIVFGQILLRPQVESLVSLLRHSPKITSLLKCLIENYAETVPVSCSLALAFPLRRRTHGWICFVTGWWSRGRIDS